MSKSSSGTKLAVKNSVDMSRNTTLAGQRVKQGQNTVEYDADGYAVSAIRDGGKSATSYKKASNTDATPTHSQMYQAAQNGNWDEVGRLSHALIDSNGDFSEGQAYIRELADEFGYNAREYYGSIPSSTSGTANSEATNVKYGNLENFLNSQREQTSDADIAGKTREQYINDMYAQNLEAELAALKSAYDSGVAELESQNDTIAEQYRIARNQVAGQNELQRLRMNELGNAQGLNTGATGQMALAQNMAYQGNLGNLWAQEAQTQADVDLAMAQLMQQYNANVNQTAAQINAQRNQALYEEMVRQQEWTAQQAELSREYALNLISNGVMPDSATLNSGGIPATTAAALLRMAAGGGTVGAPQTITMATTSAAVPNRTGSPYNNGSLTTAQVMQLQGDINKYLPADQQIAVDGKWGQNTTNAAGGLTADQYANIYYKQNSWSGRSDR